MNVIAIDGPAGAGKSTIARALAARLGLEYLDTGAMYRAVTFAALRRGVDLDDPDAVAALAREVALEVDEHGVTVDGLEATAAIRTPEVTASVSTVAANSGARSAMRARQLAWALGRGRGGIAGGDLGSGVFRAAALAHYLRASTCKRADAE